MTKLRADPRLAMLSPEGLPLSPAPFIYLLISSFPKGLLIMPMAHQAHFSRLGLPVSRKLPKNLQSLDAATGAWGGCHALNRNLGSRERTGSPGPQHRPGLPQGQEPGQGGWQGAGRQSDAGRLRAVTRAADGHWGKRQRNVSPGTPKIEQQGTQNLSG